MGKQQKRKIAIIDAETDPFKFGRVPKPFVWGFRTNESDDKFYRYFWGNNLLDCTKMLLDFLEDYPDPLLIYAHNGGKFDFLFFIEHFSGNIRIVNGRILEAKFGIHTFRDSYAILPISLRDSGAGKLEISYKLLEEKVRDNHREEILTYLEADCDSLFNLVNAFAEEFGDILTIGSASMKQFKSFHKFKTVSKGFDKFHRQFYFGGRCQCFETGVVDMPIKVYDVKSSYPYTMANMEHPIGNTTDIGGYIKPDTMFVHWRGKNFNAVPTRTKTGLDFEVKYGEFYSSIHEFNAALDVGAIIPHKILSAVNFTERMKFTDFVMHFYESRLIAKKHGDKFLELFYKLILNSSYGKFAQNPEHYCDSIILPWGEIPPEPEYILEYRHDQYAIWSKPALKHSYYNVATAASITGGSRSILLRGLAGAIKPLYCDTDSIFCASMAGDRVGDEKESRLGHWALEKTGTQMAIAGKKLYALMDDDICVKKASKGCNLNPLAIFQIARGDTVETRNDSPSFKLGVPGKSKSDAIFSHVFIERNISRTGKEKAAS
jgi:DNA polymerase type B, organellar and viral